jgi:hypothetical protein
LIRILDDDLFFDLLLSLALDLNVFFSKRLFSVSHNLIFKMVKSQRIAHDELGLGLIGPFGFECDREVSDAISLDREGRRVGRVNDKVIAIFRVVRSPGDLDIPVSFSIVDDRQVLSDLTSGGDIHLKNGLQRLWLNREDDSISSNIRL